MRMESFNDYKKMQEEVENNLMTRLHPILTEIQTGLHENTKATNKINDKVDGILAHPMFKAWNTTTSGVELFKLIGKLLLWVMGIIIAIKYLGISFIQTIKEHL